MYSQLKQTKRVKPIFAYIKDSVKFYDIDHAITAKILFVLQLAVVFGGYIVARPYIQQFLIHFEQFSTAMLSLLETKPFDFSRISMETIENLSNSFYSLMFILLATKAASYIIGMYYGTYYYLSQIYPEMSGSERTALFFRRLPKLALFNIMYYILFYIAVVILIFATGLISLFVPVIYAIAPIIPLLILSIDLIFMFKNLLIIEFDVGIIRNFKKSLDITKGCKKNIIINGLWPILLGLVLNAFSIDIENQMLSLFITAFLSVIVLFITERLTVLMFIDAASMERKGTMRQEYNENL